MDKQIVIRRGGWGFLLPPGDAIEMAGSGAEIKLRREDDEWVYPLLDVEESDDEVVYTIEAATTNGHGYPFPSVAEEIDRLRSRWERAHGDLARFNAWAEGAGYDSHLRHLRQELRRLESAQAAAG